MINSDEKLSEVKINVIPEEIELKPINAENLNRFSVPDLIQNSKIDDNIFRKNERSRSLDPSHKLEELNALKNRIASFMSLNELSGDVISKDQKGIWYNCLKFKSQFMNSCYLCICNISGKN